ncbi:hypothetical protein [Frigoriglobus tundricola]|uniref:Uncharacterized protein n=1 Tax=Frigoriglobus tundricola TaxID=2774151 RepID=A0A6M5YHC5_9BACT|nr:hypothetical protein [Frigoriglobus tundricola]QJW92954.1 hypothetical protein FTUN_0452 [Frigoriglobus tundricola]
MTTTNGKTEAGNATAGNGRAAGNRIQAVKPRNVKARKRPAKKPAGKKPHPALAWANDPVERSKTMQCNELRGCMHMILSLAGSVRLLPCTMLGSPLKLDGGFLRACEFFAHGIDLQVSEFFKAIRELETANGVESGYGR